MTNKNNIAYFDWSLDIEYPHCKKEIDLVNYDGEGDIASCIFYNNWDFLNGYDIYCNHCDKEFQIKEIQY